MATTPAWADSPGQDEATAPDESEADEDRKLQERVCEEVSGDSQSERCDCHKYRRKRPAVARVALLVAGAIQIHSGLAYIWSSLLRVGTGVEVGGGAPVELCGKRTCVALDAGVELVLSS